MISRHDEVIDSILASLPKGQDRYPLSEPVFSGNESEYLRDCIDTRWVSSAGPYVDKFESMLSEFTGAKFVVVTSSGTAALHVALIVAGISTNDEVLVPAVTFVATANAVAYCNAIPHFVDCNEVTLGVDPQKLDDYLKSIASMRSGEAINKSTGRRIKALVVMHTFGHPVELDEIAAICEKYKLLLLEDAAEALGSYYKGRHVGNHGVLSSLSFNGNKIITTGGGGAVLCNDDVQARKVRHITTTAKVEHPWRLEHDQIGFNYRMPNINAALGCAQLENIETKLQAKRELAARYKDKFASCDSARLVEEPAYAKSNYWLNAIILSGATESDLQMFIEKSQTKGLMVRPLWRLLNKLPMYVECPAMDLSTAEKLERELINLPSC